jgi:hypothetical protein
MDLSERFDRKAEGRKIPGEDPDEGSAVAERSE